jgi:hypothetical protein
MTRQPNHPKEANSLMREAVDTESQIRKLSDEELICEVKTTEDLIYHIECFGTRDLMYLQFLYREVERRGLEGRVSAICLQCGSHDGLDG